MGLILLSISETFITYHWTRGYHCQLYDGTYHSHRGRFRVHVGPFWLFFFQTNNTDCASFATCEGGEYQHPVQFGAIRVTLGGKYLPARILKFPLCAFQDT
jgi:hypothetical protein